MPLVVKLKNLVRPPRPPVEAARPIAASAPDATAPDAATPASDAAPAAPVYRCKACGYLSDDPSYCPDCLADTMRPLKRGRRR